MGAAPAGVLRLYIVGDVFACRHCHRLGYDSEGETPKTDTQQDLTAMAADEAMTRRALELLGSRRNDAYEAALAALREDKQAWWADTLACDPDELGEREEPATADVEGLRRFLEGKVLPWFANRQKELANRPLIREQAFGEAPILTSWSGLDATRFISTASSSECSPCCCGSRSYDVLPSRANPFGKMSSLTRIGWGERRRYVGRF